MNLKKLKNKLFRHPGQRAVIAVPYIWLLILFLIPFAIVLKISFAEQEIAIPPFTPLRATACCWQSCCLSGPLSCCVFTHGWVYWDTTASSIIS